MVIARYNSTGRLLGRHCTGPGVRIRVCGIRRCCRRARWTQARAQPALLSARSELRLQVLHTRAELLNLLLCLRACLWRAVVAVVVEKREGRLPADIDHRDHRRVQMCRHVVKVDHLLCREGEDGRGWDGRGARGWEGAGEGRKQAARWSRRTTNELLHLPAGT
jgi:hypothetical protein